VTEHPTIDDVSPEEHIAQVTAALEDDLGDIATHEQVAELATVAYERVSYHARIRSFLPVLAEREARTVLRELARA
jgi:hypothetical protein